MISRIASYIKANHMVQPGDHVCVGVSGGADSVCLFLVLEELRHSFGFSVSVVHIEHGIRGQESVEDMDKYLTQLREKLMAQLDADTIVNVEF